MKIPLSILQDENIDLLLRHKILTLLKQRRVEFKIDPSDPMTGVDTISIVANPAMESEFVALSKDNQDDYKLLHQCVQLALTERRLR